MRQEASPRAIVFSILAFLFFAFMIDLLSTTSIRSQEKYYGPMAMEQSWPHFMQDVLSRVPDFPIQSVEDVAQNTGGKRKTHITSSIQLQIDLRKKFCNKGPEATGILNASPGGSSSQVDVCLYLHILSALTSKHTFLDLPLMESAEGAPKSLSRSHLKAGGTGILTSSTTAGPTKTQRSLEKAVDEIITLAIPGMASDGKAVDEGSRTETFPDPFANQDRTTVGTHAPDTMKLGFLLG